MAPTKRSGKGKAVQVASRNDVAPPAPFKFPAPALEPFIKTLSKKHIYITHIDSKPADFKNKIFLIPIGMNLCVVILFVVRMYYILPWYWKLALTGLGHINELSFNTADATWKEAGWVVFTRALAMLFDFLLFVFVWPWPVEFAFARAHGNPCQWRWRVGFRAQEIYVRRSREWDEALKDIFADESSKTVLFTYLKQATNPLLQEQKTGYLLLNAQWNLDWTEMIHAHSLVDNKEIAIDAFKNVILLHHRNYGWISYDRNVEAVNGEEERRRQVFAFRDALTDMDKEDLFYRWVEVVQYEASQPGGFGAEKQEAAAKKIRGLFEAEDIDFDELWKKAVGSV